MAAVNKKALSRLLSLDGAITSDMRKSVHLDVISTNSPSLNFVFGKGQGLPKGYSVLLYGPPRGGKSIIVNMMIGWLHQSNPNAIAIKFNTEFREAAQLSENETKMYGIDPTRVISFEVNQPDQIFDRIEKEIAAEIQDGMEVGLVAIDSLTGIQGRRSMNADSIMTQQIGDNALTIQEGLKRIMPVQRKHKFALVLTSHIRSVMDNKVATPGMVHKSHTMAIKPAVSFATQHHCEYYLYVEPRGGKEGRQDESGKTFTDTTVTDARGENEVTGHRIMVRMVDSSLGPKGRSGLLTFDYNKGIINVHEEVYNLGVDRGIVDKPNNQTYAYKGKEWRGKQAFLEALKNDPALQESILNDLKMKDLEGTIIKLADEKDEAS